MRMQARGSGSSVSFAKGGNGQAATAWQLSGRPESGSVGPAADTAPGSVSALHSGLPHSPGSIQAGRGRGEVRWVRGKEGPGCRAAQGAGRTLVRPPLTLGFYCPRAKGLGLPAPVGSPRRAPDFTALWDATPGPVSGSWP